LTADANYDALTGSLSTVTANITDNDGAPAVAGSSVVAGPIIVIADGTSVSTINVTLRNAANSPIPGNSISLSSSRGGPDDVITPLPLLAPTDLNGQTTGTISSLVPGVTTITATDTTSSLVLPQTALVYFTQGQILKLNKSVDRQDVMIGDLLNYTVIVQNNTANDALLVKVADAIPGNFKYRRGSTRINNLAAPDPLGSRPLVFDLGTVPALVDGNGNGQADLGEPGYVSITYQLIVGSGASPGEYVNTAVARDVCNQCLISNTAEAVVEVIMDPLFDLGTIVGKVFEDKDRDGRQDEGEDGISDVMVALDNGTYALTDDYGRYHFPAVEPGERLVKINLKRQGNSVIATAGETRILSVTPGLMAKASFGVVSAPETVKIGRQAEYGVQINNRTDVEQIRVFGNAKDLVLLINDQLAAIPSNDINIRTARFDDIIEIHSGQLPEPVEFIIGSSNSEPVDFWLLEIVDSSMQVVKTFKGVGLPPESVLWDARDDQGEIVKGGSIYQYQIHYGYADGVMLSSNRKMFGVNQTTAVAVNLTGSAFEVGATKLSTVAEESLKVIAGILEKYPEENIVIEGHTDSVGSVSSNLELSQLRAQSAADYLINELEIDKERVTVQWYGESRPIASNAIEEGREINRRIEIAGEMSEVDESRLVDQFRRQPQLIINGETHEVDGEGRFLVELDEPEITDLDIELINSEDRSFISRLKIPSLSISEPVSMIIRSIADQPGDHENDGGLAQKLVGTTEPGNIVELDGRDLPVDEDGVFGADLDLKLGRNSFGILVRNSDGFSRIANLNIVVSDKDENGGLFMVVEPVPELTVVLPPGGQVLHSQLINISGFTDPANTLTVNGDLVRVAGDGSFTTDIKVPEGESRVIIKVVDRQGFSGMVERDLKVDGSQLFFMAIADGKAGLLQGSGNLKGAGMSDADEFYTEGRIAYYLKGVVKGKYLVTSSFDTGTGKFEELFQDLDAADTRRFFRNIDPDKLYPVYGDSSTIVYDTESQGKLYLAVSSDEIDFLLGNSSVQMTDTELAAYRRSVHGARFSYKSVSKSRYGAPDTKLVVFGAQVREAHVRDELLATGGSLYYLSNIDVNEGSEQVTMIVRDKDTGNVLRSVPQQRNMDYTIHYSEGRIIFSAPVSSMDDSGSIVDRNLLAGNPVYIQVDYETTLELFEKTAVGGRIRQQVGDNIAIGATYVQDELGAGQYELSGVDAELRFGKTSRITAEFAETTGTDSLTYVSSDGGITYVEATPNGLQSGAAYKLAVSLDLGEFFGRPGDYLVDAYFKELENGFLSSGNFRQMGTTKTGLSFSARLSARDILSGRFDDEDVVAILPVPASSRQLTALQWTHDEGWWQLTSEYQSQKTELETSSLAAARLRLVASEKLLVDIAHQFTIEGVDNDKTSVGAAYQISSILSLNAEAAHGSNGDSAKGGLALMIGESRVYLNEMVTDHNGARTNSTILGSEVPFDKTGRVYSEYQWLKGDNGDSNMSLVGARKSWALDQGLNLILSGEHGNIISSQTGESSRYAFSAGLNYARQGLKASTRNELRRQFNATSQFDQYLTNNSIEAKLNPDFTLLGRYLYSETRDVVTDNLDARLEDMSVGFAYRPVRSDRLNALARITRINNQRTLLTGSRSISSVDVASLEWTYDLTDRLEWAEKIAARSKTESDPFLPDFTSNTYLTITRLNYNFWLKFDLGVEFRMLTQDGADDSRAGWLVELMWEIRKHLRVGGGYNFTDFSDNEFSDNDYSAHGFFARVQAYY
jgi:uncharacterized repeat protein (TIGR01451 family)